MENKILEKENKITILKNNEEKLTTAIEEANKSIDTLKSVNEQLSSQIEESQQEMDRAISTQRKLQKKINSLEKSTVTASPDNPNKPIEHFYFDNEMVDIINKDILRKN